MNYQGDILSKLSLGTVQFGLDYGVANNEGQPKQEEVNEIVKYVSSSGVNCFDTAQAYGNAEAVIGKAIKEECVSPYIISKISSDIFLKNGGTSIADAVKILNISALYGLLLHDSKLLYQWSNECTEKVNALIEKKLIKNFGASIYTEEEFELAIQNPYVRIIQVPFNVFDQRAVNKKWFQRVNKAKKLIFIRSIFLQGLFFMHEKDLTGSLVAVKPYLRCLNQWCEKTGLTVSEFAMAYVDSVATHSILLFGSETLEQTQMNIRNYNKLPCFDVATLAAINKQFSDVPEVITNPSRWFL